MSVGSLRAIAQHSQNILNALDKPMIKENLTESWLQGKIAITEDYMRTIHDFVMYVSDAADTISAGDKPGLWDNIRKKKEKEAAIAKDPLPALRARLIAEGHANEEQLSKMQADLEAEIADAEEFGMNSPLPSVDELRRDVFAEEIAA
jgi:hypothetical protein